MDEFMLMNYLKSKGMGNMSEQEFIHKFKEFMYKYGNTSYMRYHNDNEDWDYSEKYRRGMPMKRSKLGYYDMVSEYPEYAAYSEMRHGNPYIRFNKEESYYPTNTMYGIKGMQEEHFNEEYAKYIVSEMHHTEGDRKQVGEKYSMLKAKEVFDRYKNTLPSNITIEDIYVAINAQYHDYAILFKSWFGNNIDSKIIESAIVFWFKDVDYNKGFKLMEYFKEY